MREMSKTMITTMLFAAVVRVKGGTRVEIIV